MDVAQQSYSELMELATASGVRRYVLARELSPNQGNRRPIVCRQSCS